MKARQDHLAQLNGAFTPRGPGLRRMGGRSAVIVSTLLALMVIVPAVATVATDPHTGNDVCDKSNKPLFDGTQNPEGYCVETVLGEVPAAHQMVSTVILFPRDGDVIKANSAFTIRTKTINLATGFFSDPVKQHYIFPQTLNDDGVVQGHSHVTVQRITNDNTPPDPRIVAFFKGLNDPSDGNGELTATVETGLPAGRYRVCTMVSSFAHQPVAMPIAQRGAQDDCVRFTVGSPSEE